MYESFDFIWFQRDIVCFYRNMEVNGSITSKRLPDSVGRVIYLECGHVVFCTCLEDSVPATIKNRLDGAHSDTP